MDWGFIMGIGAFVIASTLRAATPLIFAALGGVFSERSGVFNIGLEGIMLFSAFFGMYGSYLTNNPWLGVLLGTLVGGLVAAVHAFLSIELRANQTVSGVALNLMAVAGTNMLLVKFFHSVGQSPSVAKVADWQVPLLKDIPFLGDAIGNLNPLVYLALAMVALSSFFLFGTTTGLRIRSVGENPEAAATVGISIRKIRYLGVIASGLLGGLGGVFLSLGSMDLFKENMTAGRGFIALAAMISGKYNPVGAFFACLLFGFAEALEGQFQLLGMNVPTQFLHMLPYACTIILILGVVGKSVPPAADGIPYEGRK
ncbi:nucleoside ABC transporter membrane protein [Hydrogenispora ethanolica]|jgi:simple sugar transport system permease protein|uniref:Nucleoside ABC transporter membrane protein n=1 Tax=Hydrogenispora ethanolica TaxID=1082276 RepID=A0A4R1QSD5_HYDET|nr:ABC transporter permease [Hydrogenispora ethanolica]TCL56809.1 nucleoside ABC transporter membrane protein [Hydrogenispora ethanolica]